MSKEKSKKPKLTPSFTMLEGAIKTWWKNLPKVIMVYIWGLLFALIPLAVAAIASGLMVWLGNGLNMPVRIILGVIVALAILVAIYFTIRAYISIFILVKKDFEGRPLDIFSSTKDYFWSYLGLVLLTAVLILLWSLLLIIPGIIYSIFYSLACYAFFFEGQKGMAAIKRSRELVRGYFWPVFGRFLILWLVFWVFTMIVSAPLASADENSAWYQIWSAVVQIINFLIGPISLLFTYHIYRDLVKIKK